jgi:hypothetical protein
MEKQTRIYLSVSKEERDRIKAFCAAHKIESEAEFLRWAVREKLTAEARDGELILASLRQLHEKLDRHNAGDRGEHGAIFEYLQLKTKRDMAYQAEIPEGDRRRVAEAQIARFNRFFEAFKKEWARKGNPAVFEAILTDYSEKSE